MPEPLLTAGAAAVGRGALGAAVAVGDFPPPDPEPLLPPPDEPDEPPDDPDPPDEPEPPDDPDDPDPPDDPGDAALGSVDGPRDEPGPDDAALLGRLAGDPADLVDAPGKPVATDPPMLDDAPFLAW